MEKYALAHNRIRKLARSMRKRADLFNEVTGKPFGDALSLGMGAPIGNIVGMAAPAPSLEKLKEWDDRPGVSMLPGVADYRMMGRQKAIRHLLKDNPKKFDVPWSDMLTGSPLIYGGLGGLLGAGAGLIHNKQLGERPGSADYWGAPILGGLVGAGIGAGGAALAEGIGGFAGVMGKKRTLAEQAKAENRKANWLLNSLMPGRGWYNMGKRLSASQRLSNMSIEDIKKELEEIKAARGKE